MMALDAGIAAADDDAGSASIWDGDGFDLSTSRGALGLLCVAVGPPDAVVLSRVVRGARHAPWRVVVSVDPLARVPGRVHRTAGILAGTGVVASATIPGDAGRVHGQPSG